MFRKLIMSVVVLAGLTTVFLPLPVAAANVFEQDCTANSNSRLCKETKNAENDVSDLISTISNTMFFLLGAICVIMIIYGGFRYITSNGDASRVKSAKDIVLYAVIGLIVALLAYAIVQFVLTQF